MEKANIINIQKYCIHDGPGIRTTVFFKGCPLKCLWCHNPESQKKDYEIMFFKERCTSCGNCIKKCPNEAIKINNGMFIIDENKCYFCGKCVDFCINDAREIMGKEITLKELMKEILKDELFYEESGGGVTFSGGEPLLQINFLTEVLKECRKKGIHTAVDTSGYVSFDKFENILDYVDLFLYDIKLMDNEKHKRYTGVSNHIILDNVKKLSQKGKKIYIRIPIISGVNDDDENIKRSIEFISNLNIVQVNLLPYHKMGMEKYERLNMKYKLTGEEKPSDEKMEKIKQMFNDAGIKAKIGG